MFVAVALRVIESPGFADGALEVRERVRRGAWIVTASVRVTRLSGTPLWSVPSNVTDVDVTVPSAVPPTAEAVTLNEYEPGTMFVKENVYWPLRTPPIAAASSETYASEGERETLTQSASASPGPAFVKFARNTTGCDATKLPVDWDTENDQLGWTNPYTR